MQCIRCEINTSSTILYPLFLSIVWVFGLICGVFLFLHAESSILPLMRGIPFCSVSIISLLIVEFVPFLFTAYAVCFSQPRLLILVCFCNASLLSFLMTGICKAFSTAGWLMCDIMLFSDIVGSSALLFLLLRIISKSKQKYSRHIYCI